MSVFKVGDGILLENDIIFQVMEVVEYNDESYLYAIETPADMADMADPKKLKYAFLREVVEEETEEVFVEKVEDLELVKTLAQEVMNEIG